MHLNVRQKMKSLERLYVRYLDEIPAEIVQPFFEECDNIGVPLEAESYPPEPQAGIEDYIPAAIGLLIAKPFLDAFMKRAGDDTYSLLAKAVSGLVKRAKKIRMHVVTSGGAKVDAASSISKTVSVHSLNGVGLTMKFLFDYESSDLECEQSVTELLRFLSSGEAESLEVRRRGDTLLLKYSVEDSGWIIYEPLNMRGEQAVPPKSDRAGG